MTDYEANLGEKCCFSSGGVCSYWISVIYLIYVTLEEVVNYDLDTSQDVMQHYF